MSFHTGFPITVLSDSAYSTTVNARYARANHLRPLKIVNQSYHNWFGTDPSAQPCASDTNNGICAYSAQSSTAFGSARVGSERDPGYKQIDLALSKQFAITEGSYVEFRGDFLNAFNFVSLAPPSNNASPRYSPSGQRIDSFGQITDTVNEPRNIQLALKVVF
jgi:hypothetical protein